MPDKRVYVEFTSDTRKLKSGLKDADRRVSGLTKAFKRLGAAIVGAFAGRAVFNALRSELFDTDRLIKTARAVGATADEFDRLSFVIEERMGASAGTASRAFKFLQIRLQDTKRTYDQYFRDAGLDPRQLRGLDPSQQVLEVIRALGQFDDASQRMAIASRLLGEEVSLEVVKLASAGSLAMQDAIDDYNRIAGSLRQDGATGSIEGIADEAANLALAFREVRRSALIEMGPGIIDAMQSVIDSGVMGAVTNELTNLLREVNALSEDFKYLASVFDDLDASIPDWVKSILNPGIGALTAVAKVPFNALRESRESASGADLSALAPSPTRASTASPVSKYYDIKVTTDGNVISRRSAGNIKSEIERREIVANE